MRRKPANQAAVAIDSRETSREPAFIVAIGASAGGLSALEKFFDHMPADSGMAFVVIQHLSPDFKSLMDDLLARHTSMAIHRVSNGIGLRADTIYLIPPKAHMTMDKGKLYLTERESGQHLDLPIDVFFSSLAKNAGDRAIAIVMSGTGSDGSRGLREIHKAGGLVLVQSIDSAQFDGMPRSAIATGECDLLLPPETMPEAILHYANAPVRERSEVLRSYLGDEEHGEYSQIFALLRGQYNLDFSKYKPPTVGRRIQRRMEFSQINDPNSYAAQLAKDAAELDHLYRDLLIGVTEFFRDPKVFQNLEDSVLPDLFRNRQPDDEIRVWTAGCATGEEAYSLAILLSEKADKTNFKGNITIFATDVHRVSLDTASHGLYEPHRLKNVSSDRLARFFRKESNGHYRVSPALRKMIVFAPHNLISDPPFTRMDLVCCRNLLIYLQPEVQEKVISLFHFALKLNGTLILGSSEGLGKLGGEFEPIDGTSKIFRKARDMKIALDIRLEPSTQRFAATSITPGAHKLTVSLDRQLVHDYDLLLKQHMPAGALINEQRQVLHCFGDTSLLLTQPEGRFENDLLSLVHENLKIPLNTALHRALKNCATITTTNLQIDQFEEQRFDLVVECLPDKKSAVSHYFVSLRPATPRSQRREELAEEVLHLPSAEISHHLQQRTLDLEHELQATRENLQTTVEELQTSNEELQATNEELLAANEELQSTNEELHSVNEELYTVNAEFEIKNKELKQLNQDHENLLASTRMGIVFLDSNLRIRKFNPSIERFFHLLPQDIGRPIEHIAYLLADQKQMLDDVRHVLHTSESIEKEVATQEGQWLLKRVLPFRSEDDRTGGVVLTFTDITRIKEAEQEVVRLNKDLEQKVAERTRELMVAKEAADQANAAKSIFLANMSHEIRTPMSGIFSAIQLLETTSLTGEQGAYLGTMRKAAENLLAIINDILDFSKIETNCVELHPETFNLAETIAEVIELHRPQVMAKHLKLKLELDSKLPTRVVGDAMRLKQVVSNLLANAIKFTEEGKITLAVVSETSIGDVLNVHVSIRDTGIGLAQDLSEFIFKPFTQADPSITRKFGGTGLGLAICKQLVEMMGGRIWYESNAGQGVTFHFTFLCRLPAGSAANQTTFQEEIDSSAASSNKVLRIMVAEDDDMNRELLIRILSKLGHAPTAVRNGLEAVENLAEKPFDLVFMDVSMPEMDGLTATSKVRQFESGHPNRSIPIIGLTAHALDEDRRQFLESGMTDVLTKPYSIDALQNALTRLPPLFDTTGK